MKRTRREKGITLIALIITIVVLLILAAVAISSITNDGILGYAQNAATDYNQAVKNEQAMLDYYESYLSGTVGKWVQNGTKVSKTTPEGTTTLTVGDYVNYISGVSGYTDANGWQILGAENGQVLLMSSSYVVSDHYLEGAEGYLNGVAELNALCAPYGNGEYADSTKTRSVNVDDINRVTGYNPETANYALGETYQYGNKVTYVLTDGIITYSGTNGKNGTSTYSRFKMPDGTILTESNSITLTSNAYLYTASSYLTDTSSNAYTLLFGTANNMKYWLGSCCVCTDEIAVETGAAYWGIREINDGAVSFIGLTYTYGTNKKTSYGVRAVVALESDVKLTSTDSNSWTLSK